MKHRSRSSLRPSGTESLWHIIYPFISLGSPQKMKPRLRLARKLLVGIMSTAIAGLISLMWNLYQRAKLDTDALSAADNDPAVIALLTEADEVAIPVIVLGEYRYGIAQSRNRASYANWLKGLLQDCRCWTSMSRPPNITRKSRSN